MGEADECTPAAVARGLGLPMTEQTEIEEIAAQDCLFIGTLLNIRNED
jgi:coenzyme F420-0:L-glutamate ligase / coenzyme F420-1:gamma-L-glutamate ligase